MGRESFERDERNRRGFTGICTISGSVREIEFFAEEDGDARIRFNQEVRSFVARDYKIWKVRLGERIV